MSDRPSNSHPRDALDELVDQLLECGAVLSQIIGQMIKAQAAGLSAPDAAPIPEVAHGVIRSALEDILGRRPDHALSTAATIVEQATQGMCENIFIVPMTEIQRRPRPRSPARARGSRRPRRRGR